MLKYEINPTAPALELLSTTDLSAWMENADPINSAWVTQAGLRHSQTNFYFYR